MKNRLPVFLQNWQSSNTQAHFCRFSCGRLVASCGEVGDDGDRVVLAAILAPELAAVADERGHGGIHDHVARDVQVGDAAVGVDHGERGRGLGEAV